MQHVTEAVKALGLLAAILIVTSAAYADLIWWDGSRETGNTPPGKLLSDNGGYYGDCVMTGVDYAVGPDAQTYKRQTRKPKPVPATGQLLDGNPTSGVTAKGPIVTVFDFKRNCSFSEINVCTQSRKVGIKIEAAITPDQWKTIFERQMADSPDAAMHRIKLADNPQGQYVRLTVDAGGETRLDEFIVWGDAEVTKDNPEATDPIFKNPTVQSYCSYSIPGIEKTGIVFAEHRDWLKTIGKFAEVPAVWSQVSTWDSISHNVLLPAANEINKPLGFTMARNETESSALALTSTTFPKEIELDIKLSEFKNAKTGKAAPSVKGHLRIAGAVPSSIYGVVLGPLFEADNMPGLSVLQRYVTNADSIHGFPKVKLPRMSLAVVWLSVTTDGAEPGIYEATLGYPGGKDVKVRAEVLNVTLPDVLTYVQSYSYDTKQFPFVYDDRIEREVAYRQSIGLNAYYGLPEPGSLQDIARKRGKNVMFQVYALPGKYHGADPATFTPEDVKAVEESATNFVKRAKSMGLDYNDYCYELWDEPDPAGCRKMAGVCEIIHRVEPKLQIYCNPTTSDVGGDWYAKHIGVSYPYYKACIDSTEGDKQFNAPRLVKGYYKIVTHSSRGERSAYIELYRREAWDALVRGWNGWGFFAYYRPSNDPWNDLDGDSVDGASDFSMVYPGPRGPIPTRPAEAVREGWEDFRLMTLLQEKGLKKDFGAIVKDYEKGVPMTELRLRALNAAARIAKNQ